MEFDLENQMSSSDDEQQPRWGSISALFAAEADHIISTVGAIDPSARRNAVSLVLQVMLYLDAQTNERSDLFHGGDVFVGRRSSIAIWTPSSLALQSTTLIGTFPSAKSRYQSL